MSSHSNKISKALRSTAYHEAGHAVCNYHSGMKVGTILVDEDIGEVSRTPLLNEDDVAAFWPSKFSGQNTTHESRRELVDRQAVSWLAGPMAEKEFNPDYDPEASDSDYEAVDHKDRWTCPTEKVRPPFIAMIYTNLEWLFLTTYSSGASSGKCC